MILPSSSQEYSQMCLRVASYPGLLTPAFVACSTNAGEGLVKLSHLQWRTWTCGGVAHSPCTAVKRLSEPKKCRQDCLMSSTQSMLAIGSVTYLLFFRECATPPHIQVRHSMWFSFTRPSPALVLQATNTGVRRLEYEALEYAEVEKQVTAEV